MVKYRAGVFAIASNALDDAEAGLLTRLRDGKAEPTPDGEARMDNYIEAEPSHQSAEATFEALVAHQKNLRRPIGDEMLIIRPKSNGKGPSSAATSETYEISLSDSFASFDQLVKTTQATLTSLKMGWEDVCQEISTLSEDILGDDRQKQDKSANESDVEKKQLLKDVKGLVDDLVKDMMAKVEAEEKTTIKGQKKMKETLLASLENMEI